MERWFFALVDLTDADGPLEVFRRGSAHWIGTMRNALGRADSLTW